MLDKLCDASHVQPADHLRSDFVADQIGENGGVTGVHFDGVGNGTGDFISGRSLAQKFDRFGPRQSNERAHSRFGAGMEKPTRRAMINANKVNPGLAELGEISRGFISWSDVST